MKISVTKLNPFEEIYDNIEAEEFLYEMDNDEELEEKLYILENDDRNSIIFCTDEADYMLEKLDDDNIFEDFSFSIFIFNFQF